MPDPPLESQSRVNLPNIRPEDYTYELPPGRIAAYPLAQRDRSRLMVCRNGKLASSFFYKLPDLLHHDSVLVMNNTRVVQARLEFRKPDGARIEVFCLEPLSPLSDIHRSLEQPSPAEWRCLVGNAKRWKSGRLISSLADHSLELEAEMAEKVGDDYRIRFSWRPESLTFGQVLEIAGVTPLPPYIKRAAEITDKQSYQTVYARSEGSVAAPTAGLHFTEEVFQRLKKKNIDPLFLTLHVGAGTFRPVTAASISDHRMHHEQFCVSRDLLVRLRNHTDTLTSVGTTSMRTLESLYWIGTCLSGGVEPESDTISLGQWVPYTWDGALPSRAEALQSIIDFLDRRRLDSLQGETSLIIVPGYHFMMVDALITNFHQPGSTLLLLVAAFAGPVWKEAYQYALDNDFRFLSYGDSCLFYPL